jgi:hypothetical protein
MKQMKSAILFGLVLFTVEPPRLGAMELGRGTIGAWDDYIAAADSRMQARLDGQRPFLWMDESAGRSLQLQGGKTLVAPVVGTGTQIVPDGLIHDWIGAIFIPGATLRTLRGVLRDYNRYKDFYGPVVADSKALECAAPEERFSMVWQRKALFVNAAIEGQYRARDFALDARRGYKIATTTQVREIEAYGHSGERLLKPGEGSGFIWRMHSIARYEARGGGVYLELEAIALTRDIPASLRWLVSPVVNRLSINSLSATLRQTREAVDAARAAPETVLSRAGGGKTGEKW